MKLTDKVGPMSDGEPPASFSLLSKHSGITLSSTIKVASSIMLNVFYHFHVFCVKEECQSQTKVFTCKTEMFFFIRFQTNRNDLFKFEKLLHARMLHFS